MMLQPGEIAPDRWQEVGPFAVCETMSECLVAVRAVLGMEGVEQLLAQADLTRESLRNAAGELKLVGLNDLAALVRQHARKAKPAPMNFKKRWRLKKAI
jgi:hypothetical protein